jgi:MFS family permease
MALLLPETTRSKVGNGSLPPPKLLRLPFPTLMRHWRWHDDINPDSRRIPNPLTSFVILSFKDNLIIITACGLLYAVYTALNASLSVLCIQIYKLDQWQAGLIYLPFGLGGAASTIFSGQLIDRAYKDARTKRGLDCNKTMGDNLDTFPIEKARLRIIWVPMVLTITSVLGFGWVLHYHTVSWHEPYSKEP